MSQPTPPSLTKRRRLLRWFVRGSGVLIALILIGSLLLAWWINRAGESTKTAALAAVRDAGIETELTAGHPSGAGTRFGLATLDLSAFTDEEVEGVPVLSDAEAPPFGIPLSASLKQPLTRFAHDAAPFRAMLAETARHTDFHYALRWWDGQHGVPRLRELRRAARAAEALSLHHQASGEIDQALHLYNDLLHLNQSFAGQPSLTNLLIRNSINALIRGGVRDALSRGEGSDGPLATLEQALEEADRLNDLIDAYRAEVTQAAHLLTHLEQTMADEYASKVAFADRLRNGDNWLNLDPEMLGRQATRNMLGYLLLPGLSERRYSADVRDALAFYQKIAPTAGDPADLLALHDELDTLGELFGLASARAQSIKIFLSDIAARRVTLAALAIERHRLAHGDWPRQLADLTNAPPPDPFSGGPLLYRRLNDGVVVYSVGPDREDDGGVQDEMVELRGDIAFRLLNPDLRGTLEAPEPEPVDPVLELLRPYLAPPHP